MPEQKLPITIGKMFDGININESGDLEFRGLAVVFSEIPTNDNEDFQRDFSGDYFLKPKSCSRDEDDKGLPMWTEYLDREGWLDPNRPVPVTWDHGRGILGAKILGEAYFEKITDEGLQFLIRVEKEKAGEYRKLVQAVYNDKSLGVSSQTMATLAAKDWSTGRIHQWGIGEVALTVTPDEHRTIDYLIQLSKSLDLEVTMPEDITTPEGNPEQDTPSLGDQLDLVIDDLQGDLAKAAADVSQEQLLVTMKSLITEVQTLQATVADLVSKSVTKEELNAVTAKVDAQTTEIGSAMKTSMEKLSKTLVKYVPIMAKTVAVNLSEAELEVERDIQLDKTAPNKPSVGNYGIPANAPFQSNG